MKLADFKGKTIDHIGGDNRELHITFTDSSTTARASARSRKWRKSRYGRRKNNMSVEIHWLSHPAEEAFVTVDDCQVPYVRIRRVKGGVEDGRLSVSLNRPGGFAYLAIDADNEAELNRWLVFLANAMAVAAGYTCHGPNSQPHNPHSVRAHLITDVSREEP